VRGSASPPELRRPPRPRGGRRRPLRSPPRPLDENQVAGPVEDAQPGAGDGPSQGAGVGDGHQTVVGAVDHEGWRVDVPDPARGVEVGPRPGLPEVEGSDGEKARRALTIRSNSSGCSARYRAEVAAFRPRRTAPSGLKEPTPNIAASTRADILSPPRPPWLVLISTSRSTRSGLASASSWATKPPSDVPRT
jgi:hypothetical protein